MSAYTLRRGRAANSAHGNAFTSATSGLGKMVKSHVLGSNGGTSPSCSTGHLRVSTWFGGSRSSRRVSGLMMASCIVGVSRDRAGWYSMGTGRFPATLAPGVRVMAAEHSLVIYYRPGLMPDTRHAIDDALEEALGDLGEVTGGGTMLDMSESDTSLLVTDVDAALPVLRDTLRRLKVPKRTVIVRHEPETQEWPVYDAIDTAPRPKRKSEWKD